MSLHPTSMTLTGTLSVAVPVAPIWAGSFRSSFLLDLVLRLPPLLKLALFAGRSRWWGLDCVFDDKDPRRLINDGREPRWILQTLSARGKRSIAVECIIETISDSFVHTQL